MKLKTILLISYAFFLSCTNNSINDLFDSNEIKKLERIDIKKRADYYSITFLESNGATINVVGFKKNYPSELKIKEKSKKNIEKYYSTYFNLSSKKGRNILLRKIYDIIDIYEKYNLSEVVNHRNRNLVEIYDNKRSLYLYSKDGRNVIDNYVKENINKFPKGVFIRDNIYHIKLK